VELVSAFDRTGAVSLSSKPVRNRNALRPVGSAKDPHADLLVCEMNKRAPEAPFPFDRKPGRNIRDARCAGPSLPDQTRVAVRRHHDRLLVSLHRALVRRLPHT
jgi:hypothetical protein